MSQIIPILNFEEGYRERPYLDTQGFPTVAGGIKIGPKGASLANYTFTVPRAVGDVWKQTVVAAKQAEMSRSPLIANALKQCNPARADILTSMAFQMGTDGLGEFRKTLMFISNADFISAAKEMLDSTWARQTSARARRHAEVMRTGTYDIYKGLI